MNDRPLIVQVSRLLDIYAEVSQKDYHKIDAWFAESKQSNLVLILFSQAPSDKKVSSCKIMQYLKISSEEWPIVFQNESWKSLDDKKLLSTIIQLRRIGYTPPALMNVCGIVFDTKKNKPVKIITQKNNQTHSWACATKKIKVN